MKMASSSAKIALRSLQDGFKTFLRRSRTTSFGIFFFVFDFGPFWVQLGLHLTPPWAPKTAPKSTQKTSENHVAARWPPRSLQDGPRSLQDGPGPPKGRPKTPQTPPGPPQMRPKSLQDRSKSAEVRPKSFEIVERCRRKTRKQTLQPRVRNPRTKQAARRSTRRKIRKPRVRSSPYDPHEESSASQRKPQEFPNNF